MVSWITAPLIPTTSKTTSSFAYLKSSDEEYIVSFDYSLVGLVFPRCRLLLLSGCVVAVVVWMLSSTNESEKEVLDLAGALITPEKCRSPELFPYVRGSREIKCLSCPALHLSSFLTPQYDDSKAISSEHTPKTIITLTTKEEYLQ